MKTKLFNLLTIGIVLCCNSGFSQEWFFGQNCGLDFSGGAPVFLAGGQTNHQEGVAVQYDCNDDLLFYSNGIDVWDASHNIIPGGPLLGSSSMTQNLAVPKPGSNGNSYYIFYGIPPNAVFGADIMWAEVDMSGPTIVSKDNALPTVGGAIFYEGITLVAHSNGTDYWLVTHRGNSARFDIYLITSTGIAWNRQESIGTNFSLYNTSQVGYMATSSNNDRIAYANASRGDVQVFSFNNANGDITGTLRTWSFGVNEWPYGVDFSPNGLYVYIGKRAGSNTGIHKGRISDGNIQFIYNAGFAAGGVRRAPDNKLYFVEINTQWVGVINNPDNYGAPNLNANAVSTAPNNVKDGLPTLPVDPICTTLPIELVSFTAKANKGMVELKWETASEEHNDYFTMERSKDALSWEELDRVYSNGSSYENLMYNYYDENPFLGTSYYRLKQTDINGKSKTFNVEVVHFDQIAEVYMVNTNSKKVEFNVNIEKDDVAMVEIYNILGEKVVRQSFELEKGSKIYEIKNVQGLNEGVYFLKIKTKNGLTKSLKFKF